ncbi:DUF365 domain-containing protein [Geoglobus acetivorans]|uniref:DUF365 domain-containing protein n=1 Tax=Geoglobus acetivorans TaxID=565033 RepID=A0ABZ3H081_GEOAI|nr:DUF365 domain-containing protein [Geoglobus acetivorans]
MPRIAGVTYPIPKPCVNRFFEKDKNVFVKPATVWKQLKPGMKFVFYQSREDTGFVGEAIIKNIEVVEDPLRIFDRYGDRVFLTKDELKEYVKSQEKWRSGWRSRGQQKKKLWLVIELENIRKYDRPVKPKKFVPVSGQYLKEE